MRDRIHVAILIDGLGWGGAEALVPEFAGAAGDQGVSVSVGYLRERDGSPVYRRLRAVGVTPVGLAVGGLLHPSSMRAVASFLSETAPDIVHTHLGYSDYLGSVSAGLLGLPVVSSVHLTAWDTSPRDRVRGVIIERARRVAVSRTIAVSHAARAALLRRGLAGGRLVVVHNGITGIRREGAGSAVREQLGIGADELVVGMVSVLRVGKGHEVAVDAVAALRDQFPGLRLVVAGDGPARADVAHQVQRLGEAGVMTGHREDVMELLDAVDVLVLPSQAEAFPTVLLEAMAAGVPVVASAVGGVREIVADGATGTLIPAPPRATDLADALRPYLEDAALRAATGRAGRERFRSEFTADGWVQRTRAVYEDVLRDEPRPLQRVARGCRARTRLRRAGSL